MNKRFLNASFTGDYMGNRKHITYLPQCSFNSYSMHPMDLRGSRDATQVCFTHSTYY